MQQEVAHAAIPLQSAFVSGIVLPNSNLFGPLVYLIEVSIGISLLATLYPSSSAARILPAEALRYE